MNKKIVAIITARGGSKGLPRKNVLDLAGKPLIAHTIEAAKQSKLFHRIIVTTDDLEIKQISSFYGADIIDRPIDLATDSASSLDVIEHALQALSKLDNTYTHFILLQPTSPLRNAEHLQKAWQQYCSEDAESLVSITEDDHHPYKSFIQTPEGIEPLFSWEYLTTPRQKLPKTFRVNGAIYIAECQTFLKTKNLFEGKLSFFIMTKTASIDIDDEIDFLLAKLLMEKNDENT